MLHQQQVINLFKIFYGNTNTVYSTSFSYRGGNGHGKNNINDGKWKKIKKLQYKQIIKIEAGSEHTLFLESNGILWCCGNNVYGQLGLGHNILEYVPTEIKYFIVNNIKIKNIKCGERYSFALDYENKVYAWGNNIVLVNVVVIHIILIYQH